MGKNNILGFNDFRQGFIALEQGLEDFCNQYLIQNTFGVKKARPSKVESYLEVNT